MGYTRDVYTVAWICALPLEMTAAKLILDKVHPSLPQPKTDHNTYTLGSVGSHNVVVACLPSGVYGTTSAAIVLAHMLPTFPSLRFGLMVGIGGGVPSKTADIRLGDVVVSMPTATSGGVIQYDYGKTLRDGNFQRTGSLNKPPQYLLTAVSQIRSDLAEGPIERTVIEVLQKYENNREQFSRPSNDWLFEASYDHETEKSNCFTCDRTQLVDRQPRKSGEPLIHYGLIASGNQVMKNAQIRDSIARQIGILCFEMEAAGLMDQLPCLVIRGICDYCDSHKHKEWQGHAALTAAAYAAHLLHAVPVAENISPRAQKLEYTEEEKACLGSLFITDPAEDKNSLKRRKGDRAFGTCSWIFETKELRHWLGLSTYEYQDKRSILWLYGNPGTGKSTMAITLSEELPSKPNFHDGSKTLAYFFCDSSSDVNRTATSVLRGLLYQLIKQQPALMKHLLPKYDERKDKLFRSFDALWAVLLDIAKNSEGMEFYYIIDALDECELESQEILLGQICQTFGNLNSQDSAPSNMHVLITSRPYHEIRRSLSTFRSKDLATYEAVASDLRKVIREKVEVLSKRNRYPKALIADVSQVLEDKAEGTFLWVGIACDELAQVQSRNALRALQALPRGLNSLYQKLLETAITASGEDDKSMILEILSLVAFALRPLTLAELSEACQLYPNEEEDFRLQFTQEVIDLCRLMIVVQDRRVRLLHKSVKDFLSKETQIIDSLQGNAMIAHRCIGSMIQNFQLQNAEKLPGTRDGFLSYASLYWPQHASLAGARFTVIREHERFFSQNSRFWNKWLTHYNILRGSPSHNLDVGFSIFHAAARWEIPQLIRFATSGTHASFDQPESTGKRKLYVDSDFKTSKGVTPLIEATRSGHVEIMRILLERGSRNQRISQNVIKTAGRNTVHGSKVMKFILDRYKDQLLITRDIMEAISHNHSHGNQIMTLLLERCKDQIEYNTHYISMIIKSFDVTVVKLLLSQCWFRFQITEGVIKAAAQNDAYRREIMILILEYFKDQIQASTHFIRIIIENFDVVVVTFFLDQCGNRFQITEDIIKSAAHNYSYGKMIMKSIIQQYKIQIQTRNHLVSTIIQSFDETVVKILLSQCGDYIQITEDICKAAARNYEHENVMSLLFDHYGEKILIESEKAWKADLFLPKVEYDDNESTAYQKWQNFVAACGTFSLRVLVAYWRSINRESGERYWNVPFRRNPNFIAQNNEISKTEELILDNAVSGMIAVSGLPGAGKTQIALELAYRIRERDPGYSIFWFSSSHSLEVAESYFSIANMLGFYGVRPEEAQHRVKSYLSQKQAGKLLLIFDRADDIELLYESLPGNVLHGFIVYTSRIPKIDRLASTDIIRVSNTDMEAALAILEHSLINKDLLDDYETAIILLEELGMLPWAITQVAEAINKSKIRLSDFVSLIKKPGVKIDWSGDWYGRRYSTHTWELTVREIQQHNQLAVDYLMFMACINPHDIPETLLPPANVFKKREALRVLRAHSILNRGARHRSLNLHPLMHKTVRNWLKSQTRTKVKQAFRQKVFKAADRLSEVFPSNDHPNRKTWRKYLPHALFLIDEIENEKEQDKYTNLIQRVGRCLFSDGRYSEGTAIFEKIMIIHQKKNSNTSPEALSSMADLAWIYDKQGRFNDAAGLGMEVVKMSERMLGVEHLDTLRSIRQLGSVLGHLERSEQAEAMLQQALEGLEKNFGLDHPETLIGLNQLGSLIAQRGKYKEAEAMLRQAFEGLQKVLGPGHPDTLTSMHNCACTMVSQDRIIDAWLLMNRCVVLRVKILGLHHPDTISSCECLRQWKYRYRLRLIRDKQRDHAQKMNHRRPKSTPAVMMSVSTNEYYPTQYQRQKSSRTAAQKFFQNHPLLRASQSGQSGKEGYDLEEVD